MKSTNTFLTQMTRDDNMTLTTNGGITRKSTESAVLDMFSLGGAYRNRTDEDCLFLFDKAFKEDPDLAMKCLFYLRDVRGGQGERRFFRTVFHWLCTSHTNVARKNLNNVSEYGRWDDLIYTTLDTPLWNEACNVIRHQLALDVQCKTPSLLAKWMPSQNASSELTKSTAKKLAKKLNMTARQYRKTLSTLRDRINVLERLMSANRWDEIEFDKIPSKAGFVYRNAFARRDIIAKKYETFAKSESTKVNAKTLYPYDIAHEVYSHSGWSRTASPTNTTRLMLQKYWENLPDYYDGREENGLAIVDTSSSMYYTPLEVAVSMGAYIAERGHGPFANHFITFSSRPQLVKFDGFDIVDKLERARSADWGNTTDIQKVFDMLLRTALSRGVKKEDMPTRLYIFSDMQFNRCMNYSSVSAVNSDLENIKKEWARYGYVLPSVIFWNVNASKDTIPAIGDGFSYVSGRSPVMIQTILSGKDGYDLMVEKLMTPRYAAVKA